MFSYLIEGFLRQTTAADLTEIFIWAMIAVLVGALWSKKVDRHHSFVHYTPTLLTSLGILGTFAGIVCGLLDFDPKNIDGSIAVLLEGLKTAFITSLVGMSLSILFKAVTSWGIFKKVDETGVADDEVDASDIYHILKQQAESINLLRKAIIENDETSLVGQLKLLRSDLSDNHKSIIKVADRREENFRAFEERLWIKLQDFADMMSKSATEQVIEALKQVIIDFNNNLTEQFGENFKQLNAAVKELVTWQENYKGQLQEMKAQYDHGVQAITQTQVSVASISADAKVIPETMNNLKAVMEVNQHQINELDRHLVAFADVRDRAVEAVPDIRAQVDLAIESAKVASVELAKGIVESADQYRDTVDKTRAALTESAQATASSTEQIKNQFSATLSDVNAHMRNMISELQESSKALTENYKQASAGLTAETSQVSQTFAKSADEIRSNLLKTIEQLAQEHQNQANKVFSGLEKSIENSLKQTGESLQKQVSMMDKTMGEEIEKVLQSMGSALASISGQFTRDYSQLVKQMSDIVVKKG